MTSTTLDKRVQQSIAKQLQIPFEDIADMDCEEIDTVIEKRIGRKLKFTVKKDDRILGRGSIYLALHRLFSMEEIEKKLKGI